jgi:hypothetical protein
VLSASKVSLAAAAAAPNCERGPRPPLVIKLGIDVHLDRYVVVRQIDGGAPQPPQRFSPGQFLEWAQKQTALAKQVYSCYEAGPFGYRLHRKLKELGITNYVVRGGVRTKFLILLKNPLLGGISTCSTSLTGRPDTAHRRPSGALEVERESFGKEGPSFGWKVGVVRQNQFLHCFGLFHHHPRVRTISRCGETLFRL